MAAEISAPRAGRIGTSPCFNEAAANGRGNLSRPRVLLVDRGASMRPRRMAAEILVVVLALVRDQDASMRPRRMAAEIRRPPR